MTRPDVTDKKNILIYILLLITVTAVAVTVWALFFRTPDVHLVPDYAPVSVEQNAKPIPGDREEGETAQPGSGSVTLTYSTETVVDLSSGRMALLFANPGRSNQDMVLQILVQETVIHQSGRITPGNQVTELELSDEVLEMLSPGGYEGSFCIFYYDRNSGEKALVHTEIPVSVMVTEQGAAAE